MNYYVQKFGKQRSLFLSLNEREVLHMFLFTHHGIVSRLLDFMGPVIAEVLFARLFVSVEKELVNMWSGSLLLSITEAQV